MSNDRATKRQQELLNFVDTFIDGNGYGPSYREIMRALGYRSVSTVATHIDGLIAKGYLIKRDHSARSLEVVSRHVLESKPARTREDASLEQKLTQAFDERYQRYDTSDNKHGLMREMSALVEVLGILEFDEAKRVRERQLGELANIE